MATARTLVILAGGQSRRMGRDKALLPAGSGTMLERVVARLAPVVDEVIVAGGEASHRATVHRWVEDARPQAGPLAGIVSGLKASRNPHAWVVACDLPDVEPGFGDLLFRDAAFYDAVVPRINGEPEGLCAVYSVALAASIEQSLDAAERSVSGFLSRARVRYVEVDELRVVDPELRSFRNLNTPEDYARWLTTQPS